MNTITDLSEPPVRARIPANLDAPDQLVAGLTARQLAILTAVAVPGYGLWHALEGRLPLPVLVAVAAALAAITLTVALGRRDGLSLDSWLIAAVTHRLRPHRLAPTSTQDTPAWEPTDVERGFGPAPLRLPAEAIGGDGVITTGPSTSVVVVAASTVTAGLHTPSEQAMLLAGYGRWLNALTGSTQIVVSARRVDLGSRALRVAETAHQLAHPALAAAAIEHAEHLLDLSEDDDRLTRTVTIACTADDRLTSRSPRARHSRTRVTPAGSPAGGGDEAARRAARTAAALSVLGSRCRVLDGGEVSALLCAAVDPWGPGGPDWSRTPPGATLTAHPALLTGPEDSRRPQEIGQGIGEPDRIGEDPPWVDAQGDGRQEDWSR